MLERNFQVKSLTNLLPDLPYPLVSTFQIQNNNENGYIYDICGSNIGLLGINTSINNDLLLFDQKTLQCVQQFKGHEDQITGIEYINEHSIWLTCSKDKTIHLWDSRQSKLVGKLQNNHPLLTLAYSNQFIATGSELIDVDVYLSIWDIRKNELVKTLDQVHSDDITQIQFHPKHSNYLISSSMDGIINLYDLNQMNEDDIIISTTNTESSIHRIGFFGPLFEYIYCLSHMETLTLWKAENMDLLYNFGNIKIEGMIDYAIRCQYDEEEQRLFLLAGSNEGVLHIYHINIGELQHCTSFISPNNSHTEIVRGVYWNPKNRYLASGSEDGKLCAWYMNPSNLSSVNESVSKSNRFQPYHKKQKSHVMKS